MSEQPNKHDDNPAIFGILAIGAVGLVSETMSDDTWILLNLLLWETNPGASLAAGLSAMSALFVAMIGYGRRLRWVTREHRDAARKRREEWLQLPVPIRRRIMLPPTTAFLLLGLPYTALWLSGVTQWSWPAWLGAEVPVSPWIEALTGFLSGPGNWVNLFFPLLGWGSFILAVWGWLGPSWEAWVRRPRPFEGRLLPSPGAYQRDGDRWHHDPTFLLGARESPASQEIEPSACIPSWLYYKGKPIFGGLIAFGQKGSGKTSLLLRMIEDALRFRADDPEAKPALMALDPKGDLSEFILREAGKHGRSADVVRLAVGGPVRWNPFGHLNAASTAREIRQAGFNLRCAMPSMGGESGSYWEDNATALLSYAMQLLAYAGEVVSFESLARLVVRLKDGSVEGDEAQAQRSFRQELYDRALRNVERLDPDGSLQLYGELASVREYFEEELIHLDPKPRGIVINTATNFLRKFEGQEYRRSFGGRVGDDDQFTGFEELVDEGHIFVLDVRAVEDGQISAALCTLAKLFCQQAILSRDRREAARGRELSDARVVVNVLDEYQQYVTLGSRDSRGDPEYLETSRSFRAIDVAATQQLSSIAAAAGGRQDAAQRVAGSFNTVIAFRHNDAALTRYLHGMVGKRYRPERTETISEGGHDAQRLQLMPGHPGASKQSVTRSVQDRSVLQDVVTDALFASLDTFEALGIFNLPAGGRVAVRFATKPHFVPPRTPQARVLELISGERKAS